MSDIIIDWLLKDDNPAVKHRTKIELLEQTSNKKKVKEWIFNSLPRDWYDANGLWYRYYITALAECGLSYDDIPKEHLNKAFLECETKFECGCGDFMLLTALMKLGFTQDGFMSKSIDLLNNNRLPDGGFLCLHRKDKLKHVKKSCYKANLHALMFLAQCHKKGEEAFGKPLIEYFLNRNIFYRNDDKSTLVINARKGWQTIDTFYPFEVMRVGLQNVVEAFSALGYGNDDRLTEAWALLYNCKDATGKVILNGSLTKSYLPKEKIGKPSKWATFYTLLAQKHRRK